MLLPIQVNTIIGQFLGNDLKLLDALAHQIAHFLQNLIHRTTLMFACDNGYSAVSTVSVTSLTDFQIGIMTRSG